MGTLTELTDVLANLTNSRSNLIAAYKGDITKDRNQSAVMDNLEKAILSSEEAGCTEAAQMISDAAASEDVISVDDAATLAKFYATRTQVLALLEGESEDET